MACRNFQQWLAEASMDDLYRRTANSTLVTLAPLASSVFFSIRKQLSMAFEGNCWLESLYDLRITTSGVGLTKVAGVQFSKETRQDDELVNLHRMQKNVWEFIKMVNDVYSRVGPGDTILLSYFNLEEYKEGLFNDQLQDFKKAVFRLFTHPALFTKQEKYDFINKVYHIYSRDTGAFETKIGMDGLKTDMSGWGVKAKGSGNPTLRKTFYFPSMRIAYSQPWSISVFLRNALQHMATKKSLEGDVLDDIERLYPLVLAKLHLELWTKLNDDSYCVDKFGYTLVRLLKKGSGGFKFKCA